MKMRVIKKVFSLIYILIGIQFFLFFGTVILFFRIKSENTRALKKSEIILKKSYIKFFYFENKL